MDDACLDGSCCYATRSLGCHRSTLSQASASRGSPADRAGVDVRPRGPQALYTFHFWCSNQSEVFQTGGGDPWQMNNVAPGRYGKGGSTFGRVVEAKWLPLTVSLGRCKGTSECSQPALPTPGSYNKSWPLQCHDAERRSRA